jgi:hypothetical protein
MADEWKYCEGKCGSKPVVGCYVTITHKLKTVNKDWWKALTDPNTPPLPPFIPIPPKLPTPKPVIPGLPPFFVNPCYLNNYPGCGDPGIT